MSEKEVELSGGNINTGVVRIGDTKVTRTKAGEIAYADGEGLITLDLNYRDVDKTKITSKTKNVLLFADGAPGIDKKDVVKALKKGAENIARFCGGEIGEIKLVE